MSLSQNDFIGLHRNGPCLPEGAARQQVPLCFNQPGSAADPPTPLGARCSLPALLPVKLGRVVQGSRDLFGQIQTELHGVHMVLNIRPYVSQVVLSSISILCYI